jgi:hypothetical protein
VLFGASNESLEPEIRVYASRNGGRTWSEAAGPQHNPNSCAWGDPSVAIARDGRQYVAFTEKSICVPGTDLTPYLVVGSRNGSEGKWTVRRVTRPATNFGFDDKPAITVDAAGRAYVAWSRLYGKRFQTTVLSSSADGGRTWSEPLMVDRALVQPQLVSAAAGAPGTVYLAGVDAQGVSGSVAPPNGGPHVHRADRCRARSPATVPRRAWSSGSSSCRNRPVRCLGPNPTITLGRNRVFVTVRRQRRRPDAGRRGGRVRSVVAPVWRGPIGR